MAEQQLNRADVSPRFEEVDGKGVAERMRSDGLGNATAATGLLTFTLHRTPREGVVGTIELVYFELLPFLSTS
jgi:hypothetical protein